MTVSIIVPYKEDRGFLAQCIESIKAQTYPCELILSQSENSVSYNFNRGLEKATGEFVKYVCDDDWLPPDSVESLVNGIGDAPWLVANATQVQGSNMWVYKPETLDFAANVELNRIHGGTTLYRTEILREIGGLDETLWTGEEYDMNLKLMSLGYFPAYLDKEVYYYRLWSGGKSKKLRRTAEDKIKRENEIKRIQALYSDKV